MLYFSTAILYLSFLIFTILFQIGLVAGKPWGEWTMGGYNKGVLPLKLRFGAFISILILSFFVVITLNKINLFGLNLNFPDWFRFLIIAFNILAVIANSITQSPKERKLWQPITIAMLVCSLVIFLS